MASRGSLFFVGFIGESREDNTICFLSLGKDVFSTGSDCPMVYCSAASRCRCSRPSADGVKIGNHFRRNLKQRGLKILAKMREGRGSRYQQDIGRALQKPRKLNWHGCGRERRCGCVKRRRLQWSEASEREKRNIPYPLHGQVVDESIV